jgi:hypothetical protein
LATVKRGNQSSNQSAERPDECDNNSHYGKHRAPIRIWKLPGAQGPDHGNSGIRGGGTSSDERGYPQVSNVPGCISRDSVQHE